MSLTYGCDVCGELISAEDVRSRKALSYKDKHFCASCKGPVLALLKKRVAAQGGSAATAGSSGEGPPAAKARTPLRSVPSSSKPPAARRAPSSPPKASPPKATPPKATRAPSTKRGIPGTRPRGEEATSPKAPDRSAKAPKSPTHVVGQATTSRGRKAVPAPQRPSAPGRPTAPGAKRRAPGSGATLGRRRAAAESRGQEGQRRLSGPLLGISLCVVGVVIVGLALFLGLGGASAPPTQPRVDTTGGAESAASKPASLPTASQQSAELEAKQRSVLVDLQTRFASDGNDGPKILDIQKEVNSFRRVQGLVPAITEAVDRLSQQIRNRSKELANSTLEDITAKSQKLIAEKAFAEAYELLKSPPRIVEANGLNGRWFEERKQAEGYTREARKWGDLVTKVKKYLGQNDKEIAIAILEENITKKQQREFPVIWEERESLLHDIRLEEAEQIRVASEIESKERAARILARRTELEKERLEKWNNLFILTEWVPLLSEGGDLENWFKTVDLSLEFDADPFPWKNTRVGDEQILSADISERETPVFVGMNGNRWLDWALEFDVQVLGGALELEPRGWTQGWGGRARFVSGSTQKIVFDSSKYSSWTSVRVEVRSRLVQALIGGEVNEEIRTRFDRGGFRFVLQPGGVCQVKNVRIKWVSTLAPGEPPPVDELSELEDEEDADY